MRWRTDSSSVINYLGVRTTIKLNIYILLNNKIALLPRNAPTITVKIVPGRPITISSGPSQVAGRVNAMTVGGMVIFCEVRQAAEYATRKKALNKIIRSLGVKRWSHQPEQG